MPWKPRGWTLVGILLAAITTLAPLTIAPLITHALAQSANPSASTIITTTVADTIYRADGTTTNGSLVISWPQFITATGQSIQADSISTPITSGMLNVQLAPNAGSNPMGSYYTVVYHLDDGSTSREYWVVPASTSPVVISTIRSTVLPASVAMQTASVSYVKAAIANAAVSPADATGYVRVTGDTMTGPLILPADPVSANQAADKHYVDTSVAATSGGIGQKVSLIPSATQVVTQPSGSELQVNLFNGVQYATQYTTGNANNGIANATASADCATGCELKVGNDYTGDEQYNPGTWNNRTHVEDTRLGGRRDAYGNPGNPFTTGSMIGQTVDVVATTNPAIVNNSIVNEEPNISSLAISLEAQTGGSNLFPQTVEGSVP